MSKLAYANMMLIHLKEISNYLFLELLFLFTYSNKAYISCLLVSHEKIFFPPLPNMR
jgi:hypothetical protein